MPPFARARTPLLLCAVLVAFAGCRGPDGDPAPAPAGDLAGGSAGGEGAALSGSVSCRECHETFHELWETSFHGRAMQPFNDDVAASLPSPAGGIVVGEAVYTAVPESGIVQETTLAGERALAIEHVLGGKDVQYFLTPLSRGRLQVLPVAYDVRRAEWFDTTASAVRHFGEARDEALDWRARALTFNTACRSCHVSHLTTHYDEATDTYLTTWSEPGISCETCHGPGEEHVRLCRAGECEEPGAAGIVAFAAFTHQQVNDACSGCHARMAPLTGAFEPGERFFDHHDLVGLEHPDHYPDGRDLGENYTLTSWLLSPCVAGGDLDCVHCHTSSGRFRFAQDPDQACAPCHDARLQEASAHTHHPPESPGSRCVACHMPTTEFARMRRSDHSMRPPMPAATVAFGSPNACNECHVEHGAGWASAKVEGWHGGGYPLETIRWARLIEAARGGDWALLVDMLDYLETEPRQEVVAASLIRLLAACADERVTTALVAALDDPSPLVRASAAQGLGRRLSAETVHPVARLLADDVRLVRVRAARALAGVPAERLPVAYRDARERAMDELEASLRVWPDDSGSRLEMGNLRQDQGDLPGAIEAFETASRLDPRGVAPRVNAAMAHALTGDEARAETWLRDALAIDPDDPTTNLNLGLLLAGQGRAAEADAALSRALAADPGLAVAAYNLCVLRSDGRLDEAIDLCRTAARLSPGEARYGYTLAFYLRQRGDLAGAEAVLQDLLRHHPDHADSAALLRVIQEAAGTP